MSEALAYVVGTLAMIGAGFALVAAIGAVRFEDLYQRMHAATKAGTLGSVLLLAAVAIHSADGAVAIRAAAAVVFFFLTAPVSAHILARTAHAIGTPQSARTVKDDMAARD
jgi:multicomponent Na+:H+ antiporter subunit G